MAIGVNIEGKKELLGTWVGKNEGSKFWMQVVTELKNRGVEQIYLAELCKNWIFNLFVPILVKLRGV